MLKLLNLINFLLEQNEAEKRITIFSVVVMGIMLLVLVVDSTARYKSDYAPRSKKYKAFLVLFFVVVAVSILILFRIYYK